MPMVLSFIPFFFNVLEVVIMEAQQDTVAASQSVPARSTQTSKDDIVQLIHLFKEPSVQ
jgi:ABC-type methionine transport system permease subunit